MTKETIKTFQYRITQATASQLVVILYDMAIEYLNDACESDSAKQAHNNIYMAQKVIDQLICGLDMQYEISANLFVIYNHMKSSLISASVSLDNNEINRITGLLKKLSTSDVPPRIRNSVAIPSCRSAAVNSGQSRQRGTASRSAWKISYFVLSGSRRRCSLTFSLPDAK